MTHCIMKKLVLYLVISPVSVLCQDDIVKAIIKSDPKWVKIEISTRIKSGKPITNQERLKYIDFCEEVIVRRRNAIQFPKYFDGRPTYTRAFPTDKEPSISTGEAAAVIGSLLGLILSLPIGISIAEQTEPPLNGLVVLTALGSEIACFVILWACLFRRDNELRKSQEDLYNDAIEIKHMFINLKTV